MEATQHKSHMLTSNCTKNDKNSFTEQYRSTTSNQNEIPSSSIMISRKKHVTYRNHPAVSPANQLFPLYNTLLVT